MHHLSFEGTKLRSQPGHGARHQLARCLCLMGEHGARFSACFCSSCNVFIVCAWDRGTKFFSAVSMACLLPFIQSQ